MSQGQSIITIDKERGLASALSIGTQIANGANKRLGGRYAYWHFDANAGSGWNNDVGVDGSPVVFHRVADKYLTDTRREAFFCDRNKPTLVELGNRLANWQQSYLLDGDNEGALEVFAERIRMAENPQFAIGSVIVDPNGYWYRNDRGDGPPMDGLVRFTAKYLCIDIILNLNTQAYKRQRGAGYDLLPPADVLKSLNKKFWLVKRTQAAGGQFLLAVGRNLPTGDHRKLGFFKLQSPEGQEIMASVEGKRQGSLLDEKPIQDLQRISAASGVPSGKGRGDAQGEWDM